MLPASGSGRGFESPHLHRKETGFGRSPAAGFLLRAAEDERLRLDANLPRGYFHFEDLEIAR